jgi:hypothetical protein
VDELVGAATGLDSPEVSVAPALPVRPLGAAVAAGVPLMVCNGGYGAARVVGALVAADAGSDPVVWPVA